MFKIFTSSQIQRLLGFHGSRHDRMVSLESIDVVLVTGKDFLLDTLAQTIFRYQGNNLGAMLFLGINPTDHLIHRKWIGGKSGMKFIGLDHGLADSFTSLFDFLHNGRIIKDSTGNLTMSTTQTQNKMQGRFLLNIVVAQGTSIFKLFSGKDKTLLIRGDAFLVLNLRFDIIDRVRRFDIERNGFTRKSFDKDLHDGRDVGFLHVHK
mmetsp:Transcript_12773/g.15377  ORF Transcript_12773/g.15377 Transcript_12773/m.15377 type:complete len:207 (+) Transcript_12773:137-757(+)